MEVRGTAGVRGRESTILCQFPPGLPSPDSTSSNELSAIRPGGIVISLPSRGGLCTSFTVSEETEDNFLNGTVSWASLLNEKKWDTLRERGRLESFVVVLVGEGIRVSPQIAQKSAHPGSGSSQFGQRITLMAFSL